MPADINFNLQPKQKELLRLIREAPQTMIGFGGANGSGKSFAIRDVNLILCLSPKTKPLKTLIFRRLSNDLLENHINPFLLKYPELEKYFNKTERIIYFPDGSTTKFGSADNEQDIYSFEGKEYDYIFVDEATHCTQMMIEFLKSRNRGSSVKCKMIFTMIPGFIGHAYFKRLFITRQYLDYEDPNDYVFLPARVWDNVIWSMQALAEQGYTVTQYYKEWTEEQRKDFTLKYSDYAHTLLHLPEQKRKARLYGDWDIFEGIFFEDFNQRVHIIKEQDYLSYKELKNFKILGGLDYGNVTSNIWGARDYNGNVIIFDELHQEKMSRGDKITENKNFLIQRGLLDEYIIADTNMWLKDAFDVVLSNTPAYEYLNAGIKLLQVSKTSTNIDQKGYRAACNDLMRNLLSYEMENDIITRQPKIKIYERCKNLIRTIPTFLVDPKNPEDFIGDDDHDYDAMKYMLMNLTTL